MKRRHPNINNEILMEKKILAKLNHPGVVTLFSTFQDYGTLYYQMEYVGGADLWTYLQDHSAAASMNTPTKPHVGCFWSLTRFFFAEAVNVLEHMHRLGVGKKKIVWCAYEKVSTYFLLDCTLKYVFWIIVSSTVWSIL
jgi:serine/threonine protein kinase